MPHLTLHYDLRHPPQFAPTAPTIYSTALDQIAWGERVGFDQVSFGEHHQAEDGYNPCPLNFASAIGGRTRRMQVRIGVIVAPLYSPIRLAEEIAVTDNILGGRLEVGFGAGYMPDDFAAFEQPYAGRGQRLEDIVTILRRAWSGEAFSYAGTTVRVTPRPVQDPMPIYIGGNSAKAIERAARIGDGFHTARAEDYELYRAACVQIGKPDPGPLPPQGPIFLWVTEDDKDRTWEWLEPHVRHQVDTYARWSSAAFGRPDMGAFVPKDGAALRDSDAYQVMTPDEAVAFGRSLGDEGRLHFSPLLAGIDPARSWEMLDLVERAVLPALQPVSDTRADRLAEVGNEH